MTIPSAAERTGCHGTPLGTSTSLEVAERVVSHVTRVIADGKKQGSRVMAVASSIHSPRCPTSKQTPQRF